MSSEENCDWKIPLLIKSVCLINLGVKLFSCNRTWNLILLELLLVQRNVSFLLHKQLSDFMKGLMTLKLACSRAGFQLMGRCNVQDARVKKSQIQLW